MNIISIRRNLISVRGFAKNVNYQSSISVQTSPQTCLLPIESAKALINSRKSGSFISISEEEDADETVSVPYILHPYWPGLPILAFDREETHCKNLLIEQKCALTVINLTPSRIDHTKLPLPRVTSMGHVELIDNEEQIEAILQAFVQTHSVSKEDLLSTFKFFQLKIDDLHFVNTMGEYTYIPTADYLSCKADPLAKNTKNLIDQISKDFSQIDMINLCTNCSDFANITDAFILSLDRFGVSLMACEGSEWLEMRMPFERVVTDLKEYQIELIKMFENNE